MYAYFTERQFDPRTCECTHQTFVIRYNDKTCAKGRIVDGEVIFDEELLPLPSESEMRLGLFQANGNIATPQPETRLTTRRFR